MYTCHVRAYVLLSKCVRSGILTELCVSAMSPPSVQEVLPSVQMARTSSSAMQVVIIMHVIQCIGMLRPIPSTVVRDSAYRTSLSTMEFMIVLTAMMRRPALSKWRKVLNEMQMMMTILLVSHVLMVSFLG